ncbi:TorD/DmsD family molecular chaperone [Pengzhenrongella sicca]|uniref:Molecular chaperone TorD family protein n=1 Tax=Pengzhenrongella sicca TaxID=2819238 RepID=A0A8A4ZA42_9MICO|nr:molecular chaperone TorD family protein [Pengzhenrongella sicca]QTE28291.1 molecular chaperone TorD family protein [Pengzhenrongella sicca]
MTDAAPSTDPQALAETLDRFAAAFTALAALLGAAPSAVELARVRDADLLRDWPLAEDPDCARGAALLLESARLGEDETQVRRDYNRLFYGPGPMIAPPYESVHRSDEHLVFDHETLQVRAAYASFGLAAPRLHKEPDDHLALELGFLGTLCVRAMDAVDARDDAELARLVAGIQDFLAEHLLTWGPGCLEQAAAGAQTRFYAGVAALGAGTLTRAGAAFLPQP